MPRSNTLAAIIEARALILEALRQDNKAVPTPVYLWAIGIIGHASNFDGATVLEYTPSSFKLDILQAALAFNSRRTETIPNQVECHLFLYCAATAIVASPRDLQPLEDLFSAADKVHDALESAGHAVKSWHRLEIAKHPEITGLDLRFLIELSPVNPTN